MTSRSIWDWRRNTIRRSGTDSCGFWSPIPSNTSCWASTTSATSTRATATTENPDTATRTCSSTAASAGRPWRPGNSSTSPIPTSSTTAATPPSTSRRCASCAATAKRRTSRWKLTSSVSARIATTPVTHSGRLPPRKEIPLSTAPTPTGRTTS